MAYSKDHDQVIYTKTQKSKGHQTGKKLTISVESQDFHHVHHSLHLPMVLPAPEAGSVHGGLRP